MGADFFAVELLRRHVLRRAEACAVPEVLAGEIGFCAVECFGDAEIEEFDDICSQPLPDEHDIGGFEVSVHDALIMRFGKRVEHLKDDVACGYKRVWRIAFDERFERETADVFHDEIERAVFGERAVFKNLDDSRMPELGKAGYFAHEALFPILELCFGCVCSGTLDGDIHACIDVTGSENVAETAVTNLFFKHVMGDLLANIHTISLKSVIHLLGLLRHLSERDHWFRSTRPRYRWRCHSECKRLPRRLLS